MIQRLVFLLLLFQAFPTTAQPLRAGWYAGEPQQFLQQRGGTEVLTGLDIEMVRAIAARAGHAVVFEPVPFPALLAAVEAGSRDLLPGTVANADRAARGQLSRPYRQDINVLVVRRGEAGRLTAQDAAGLRAALLADPGFRLGVRAGFSYVDPGLDAFIADPREAQRVRQASSDAENLRRLLAGEVDGFLAERLSIALLISRSNAGPRVEEAALRLRVPLHLMFSRAVPAEKLAAFDAAIAELSADGTLARINARFRLPALLSLTLGSDWFLILEILGTVTAALAGYLAARQDRYSLFGALVLASLAALAGGVLRDLLIGRHPIGIMQNPIYLLLVFGTVLVCFLLGQARRAAQAITLPGSASSAAVFTHSLGWLQSRRPHLILFEVADALALSSFMVVGVAIAVGFGVQPLWLWGPILGTLTGAGGGILRDIVRGRGEIPNLRTSFYCEIALIWALALSLYLGERSGVIEAGEMLLVVAITVIGGAVTRLAVVAFGIRPPQLP
jgi:polar amino acid transport system substrate-binding protein